MKRMLALSILLAASAVIASVVLLFDPVTGQIQQVIPSADTLAYIGKSNALINPVFPTNPLSLCWVTNNVITPKTQAQLDAEFVVASNANVLAIWLNRSNTIQFAKDYSNGTNTDAQYFLRALFTEVLREVNEIRGWHGSNALSKNFMLQNVLTNIQNDPK